MNQQQMSVKSDAVPRLQLFNCGHANCGATFTRKWRLEEHETVHSGARPNKCPVEGCGRQFSRKSHLRRHALAHKGKSVRCSAAGCSQTFTCRDKLKRHFHYAHKDKDNYFKVGCGAKFDTHIARKAHEKTHRVSYTCSACKRTFVKRDALRRHKRTHALQKPVLLCPSEGCKAYFSTTFNLQHHIRKVHLKLLRHFCAFPDCNKAFAMRVNTPPYTRQRRSSKSWQKRLEGRSRSSLVEDDLRRLFCLRMRFPRRTNLEADLTGLFNERKIPHRVDPEVNLRDLFNIKPPQKVKG
ncbi:P43 5S RNA-binding protein [Bagarius yarrelli]|uniref:P43 5S RNA-binding protein n=1 Tax=Bagarius yarrelli TaxID=175774 RepID=A0A556VAR6_BAGYA|nr:P43 5S RNA-binding protein [Bagarius yarrelli]